MPRIRSARLTIFAIVTLLIMSSCLFAQQSAIASPTTYYRDIGYIPMRDGIRLAYVVYRPTKEGRFPALLQYDPYTSGGVDADATPAVKMYLAHGYAFVGATIRGEGCSQGAFSMLEPIQGEDGAQIVDWIGSQPWSTGAVGMVGNSYPGHTQIMTAANHPTHLKAIAAGGLTQSVYREAFRPAGIFNVTFSSRWGFLSQPASSGRGIENRVRWGDQECSANHAAQPPVRLYWDVAQHTYYDDWWKQRSLETFIDRVNVPAMIVQGWQDHQTQSTGGQGLYQRLNGPKRLVLQSGGHGVYGRTIVTEQVIRWMDHWVKGEQNGVEEEPPVLVWWEVQNTEKGAVPGWSSKFSEWPVHEASWQTLYLTGTGKLSPGHAITSDEAATRSYTFPVGTEFVANNTQFAISPDPTGVLTYRTAPMTDDLTILGMSQLTLYVSAEQKDTDFMVTLHDVAPNGDVLYLQRAFLRASLRRITPERSTSTEVYRSFDRPEELVPGNVYELKFSVPPLGAVIRKGHSLELSILSPSPVPQPDWGLLPVSLPGRNTVYHGGQYESKITIPVLDGARAQAAVPQCGFLEFQPCRPGVK